MKKGVRVMTDGQEGQINKSEVENGYRIDTENPLKTKSQTVEAKALETACSVLLSTNGRLRQKLILRSWGGGL